MVSKKTVSKRISGILKIFIIIMASVCIGAVLCIIIGSKNDIPKWVEWKKGVCYDQSGQYEITLKRKSVSVMYDNTVTWTSPDGVKVQQVLSCDIDNDYEDELILLCWKTGRFGSHKPFWVEEDEEGWSQHIFVYEYGKDIAGEIEAGKISDENIISAAAPGEIRAKWMSSYIGQDVAEISSNGKGAPHCRLLLTSPDGEISSWVWDSWGFTRENADIDCNSQNHIQNDFTREVAEG